MSSSTPDMTSSFHGEESQNDVSFIDVGANLLDEMYQGNYRGKQRHEADLQSSVLQRAFDNKVEKIIITCGTLEEAKRGLELAKTDDRLFSTVGVHPTRCSSELFASNNNNNNNDDNADDNNEQNCTEEEYCKEYIQNLKKVIDEGVKDGHIVAMGELGLDYARLEFSNVDSQKRGLIAQLELAKETKLPLFLHNRDTGTDLLDMLKLHYSDDNDESKIRQPGGVVHSFDDTFELAQQFMNMGLFIGLNGCSLKTQENLNVAKQIPLEHLLLETDCPWCDIRATHAGHGYIQTKFPTKNEKKYEKGFCVKGRYEPIHIVQVAEVIAGVKGISVEEVANASKANALKLFGSLVKKAK